MSNSKAARGEPNLVIDRTHWLWSLRGLRVDIEPGPSIQWYVDRWLSDADVHLMDWEARGIHHHLIQVAWKDIRPPGSFPSIEEMRLQVRSPPDEVWDRHWQILSRAWRERHGRMWQPGTCRAYLTQIEHRLPRVKAAAQKHQDELLTVHCTVLLDALQDPVGALQRYESALQLSPSPSSSSIPSPEVEDPVDEAAQRVKPEQIDRVIDGLNEGVKILRQLQGRPFRRLSSDLQKRRRAAAELVRTVGEDAWKVARNVPLHRHYRGDNDRQTEYLDISFQGILNHPESLLELCPSEDAGEFKARLSAALRGRQRIPTEGVATQAAPASVQDWRDRKAIGGI